MEFNSLKAVLEMGGHGAYVWSAYCIFVITVILLIVLPMRRYKVTLKRIADQESLAYKRANQTSERVANRD